MKSAMAFALVLALGAPAFAGVNSRKIFKGLQADVVDVTPAGEQDFVLNKKDVGGVKCIEKDYRNVFTVSDYECVVKVDGRDDSAVYNAMKADEVEVPTGLGRAQFEKTVGSLVCTKSYAVVANPTATYSCRLN